MHVLPLFLALLALVTMVAAASADEPSASPLERALASPQATGLLVVEVVPDTQAAALGLREGDVLVSYAGVATLERTALRVAIQAAGEAPTRPLHLVRADGTEHGLTLAPGPIGVHLVAVTKGEAVAPLPPATDVRFDFGALADQPHDDWYAFHLTGQEGKRGFEHALVTLEDGNVVMRREVAFDGGEPWEGVNHFDVTVRVKAAPAPVLSSWRFETPPSGFVAEGRVDRAEAPTLVFTTHEPTGQLEQTVTLELTGDLPVIASYFVETLACFMPREPGACFHYRGVIDGSGAVGSRPSALVAVREEAVEVAGKQVPAYKFEVREQYRGTTTAFWVGKDGRVLKADYGGAKTVLVTQAEALKGLHADIEPRTAD